MLGRRPIALLCSAVVLTFAACRDVNSIVPFNTSMYVLETVNGFQTPAVASRDGGAQVTIVADTLIVAGPNSMLRRSRIRYIGFFAGVQDTTIVGESSLRYEIDGHRITIGIFTCPPNADCVGPSTGYVDADRIDITGGGIFGGAALHYTRR